VSAQLRREQFIDSTRCEILPRFDETQPGEWFGVQGECLSPWLRAPRDAVWCQKGLEPVDSDIIVVKLIYRLTRSRSGAPGWACRKVLAMKQLRIVHGVRWLASHDGWLEWPRRCDLLGTVTRVFRPGLLRRSLSTMAFDRSRSRE
jgi:hypothetical protein